MEQHASDNGPSCDQVIINHVQDAIISIKALKEQCNISRIFKHLKENLPADEKIKVLTEKCLIRQLEMAVSEGILSRKYGSTSLDNNMNGNSYRNGDLTKNGGQISSSNKLNIVSSSTARVLKLPISEFTLKNDKVQVKSKFWFLYF